MQKSYSFLKERGGGGGGGVNESGVLHDIQADTKDIQLKTAFHECPVALQAGCQKRGT